MACRVSWAPDALDRVLDVPKGTANATHLLRMQRERGICSVPECDQPIAGWCATCAKRGAFQAPKWCREHLAAHCAAAPVGREHTPHWLDASPR